MASKRFLAAVRAFALAACLANPVAHAATTLGLTEKGVLIDNGAGNKVTLAWPVLVNASKAKAKIAEKTVADRTAVLKYEGGGQLDLSLTEGKITLQLSALPAGVQSINAVLSIGTDYAAGGKWQAGGASGVFPAEKASKETLHSGHVTPLVLTNAAGVVTAIGLPPQTYEQLQDFRQWNIQGFGWQFWTTLVPGTLSYVITVGDTVPVPAPVAAKPATPAVATAKSKPPVELTSGGTRLRKWKDGKQAVFMMEFDDSCPSHIKNVIPELEKRKMVGTFYIVPGIGPYQNLQSAWEKAALSPYVELANHTWTHSGSDNVAKLDVELAKCNEVILKARPDRKQPRLISFGTPGGVPWKISKEEWRAGFDKYNLINRPSFFGPPFHQKSAAEMIAVVDYALSHGDMTHLDFHGVGGDWHITPMEWFTALLDKLEADRERLWITDPVSWHKYDTERKGAQLKELVSNESEIRVSLTSGTNPGLYDLPLTLSTQVPAAWKACVVTQGKTVSAPIPVSGGEVRYDALPGADEILIRSAPAH
ncbi:MAG: polysaccharide deacetylase family protein [Opitutaceae bacterium]|jgi:peptidoglycan/xylan/chitin deacetylase (PgdA/CDA1 family)